MPHSLSPSEDFPVLLKKERKKKEEDEKKKQNNKPFLHDNFRLCNAVADLLVREDLGTVGVDLVLDLDILSENGDSLQARPAAHNAVPANNGRADPRIGLDHGVVHNRALLEPDTILDDHICANVDIRTNFAPLADLGGGILKKKKKRRKKEEMSVGRG